MDDIEKTLTFWETLKQIFEEFNKRNVNYCIVGGIALILHGIIRRTIDVDLFIDPEPKNLKKVIECLKNIFQDEELEKLKTEDFFNYSVIRYGTPQEFYIDIITKFGEAISWEKIKNEIEWINLEKNLKVPVASVDLLIEMKKVSSLIRERDKIDLIYLEKLRELNKNKK